MVRDAQELTPAEVRPLRRAVSDEDKAERRTNILAAAKEVFAAKGYHATTVADIARAAGLSYGSIYWYYDSKETLFHELMTAEASALQDHIDAAIAAAPHGLGDVAFRAAVRATFEFYEADAALVKLLFRDAYSLGERFERHLVEIQEQFLKEIEEVIRAAQRRGAIVDGPPRLIASTIAGLVGQIAHRRLLDDDGLEPGVVADFVVSLLLNGLVPRARAPARTADLHGVDPERTPVVVAAGQVVDRERSLSALELVTQAAAAALEGTPRLGRAVERVSVVNILTRSGGPAPATQLTRALGLRPAALEVTTVGGSAPQWLVQRAAADIAAGRLSATLIAGAEAVRSGRLRPPSNGTAPRNEIAEEELPPDPVVGDDRPGSSAEELDAGLAVPAVVYPLLESALTRRDGRSLGEQRRFIGDLLAPFSAVASRHPQAWFPVARTAEEIATPTPDNRLVAEPYTKLMTAFLGGSHGAAIVVTSLAVARSLGLDDGAMFVRSTATADDVWFPTARPDLGASPAIAAAAAAALDAGGLGLDELGFVDLYSCFPCAVQMGAAAIGLPLDDPRGLTVTGGLPYFGGPGSNYATHAIATMFELLRERGGHGLVTALGWMVTKHAVGCYSATPAPGGYRTGGTTEDQVRIDAAAVPVVPRGEQLERQDAVVEGGTVVYGHDGRVIAAPVIATLADGRRVAAAAEADELPALTGVALAGARVTVHGRPPRFRVACPVDGVEQVG